MNNSYLKSRFIIFSALGKVPKTSILEDKQEKLYKEYEEFSSFQESDELDHFNKLESFVTSKEFQEIKKNINSQKFNETSAYKKEKDYHRLRKSKDIKTYYLVKDSKELQNFIEYSESDDLAKYNKYQAFFTSKDFPEFKKSLVQDKKNKTIEYKNEIRDYKKLKKQFAWFFKLKESKEFDEFRSFEQSESLKIFIELENYINALDLSKLKEDVKSKKQEKIAELHNLRLKLKDLQKQAKKVSKDEEFSQENEILELQDILKSGNWKKEIHEIKFENTNEYKKIEEFKKVKKSIEIKRYNKFLNSSKYKEYIKLEDSKEINDFIELDTYINSQEFIERMQAVKDIIFEKTEEYQQFNEYKTIKKSAELKQYLKFLNSNKYKIYIELNESDKIQEYEELEKYIESDEFLEHKKYMLTKDKFKLSDEYKQLLEYKKLKKSEKIIWYFNLKKSNNFGQFEIWEKTFSDEFDTNSLDTGKWLTSYFWGETLLNDSYVQANDKHFYTKGENISISASVLNITTKKENAEGKMWHPKYGFIPKKYEYTSGIINTGQSFRQKYGLFKAKVQLSNNYPVFHAFWLLGGKKVPEIDVFKYQTKSKTKIHIGNYWGNSKNEKEIEKNISSVKGKDFSDDYYIYSIEWSPEQIIWKVNDVVVYQQTNGVPQEEMYLVFNSGINKNIKDEALPSNMNIDWVRVYQKK
ncbi:MAG: family 16 glycosylhydrolase [Bacteroidota bacterium]|nr:family 16 glycosylhydrolase [Bacteroidota bacterium]